MNLTATGYNIFRKGRQEAYRGVAILLNNRILAHEVVLPEPLQTPHTTALLVSIRQSKDPIYIATLYSNPSTHITSSLPLFTFLAKFRNMILAADINCQHHLIGDPKSDNNDGKLFQYLQSPLININVEPTRFANSIET